MKAYETLTPRELEIVQRIALGESNDCISKILFIQKRTVEVHLGRIISKMSVPKSKHPRVCIALFGHVYSKQISEYIEVLAAGATYDSTNEIWEKVFDTDPEAPESPAPS